MSNILYLKNCDDSSQLIIHSENGVTTTLEYLKPEHYNLESVVLALDSYDISFDINIMKEEMIEYLDDYFHHFGGLPMDFLYSLEDSDCDLVFSYEHFTSFLTPEELKKYNG